MIAALRRLGRWLVTPRTSVVSERPVCDFCERGHHVHDTRTGACITSWCYCEVQR